MRLNHLSNGWRKSKLPADFYAGKFNLPLLAETATPEILPDIERREKTVDQAELDQGYVVVCWDDPVNLMEYVTHVFQTVFQWPKSKAEYHMLQVHNQGKSALARESLEKAEHYVHLLQQYSLHATLERE